MLVVSAFVRAFPFTLTPTLYSKQGLLLQGEWRHRLINGSYSIKASGIFQLDPAAFERRFTPLYTGDQGGSVLISSDNPDTSVKRTSLSASRPSTSTLKWNETGG